MKTSSINTVIYCIVVVHVNRKAGGNQFFAGSQEGMSDQYFSYYYTSRLPGYSSTSS
jgi:hypothetical protein